MLWIIGGLLALLFPSLGPIYVNPEWYEHLETPVAAELQSQLWTHYRELLINSEQPRLFLYEGIAALPSLHVGIVALYTFFLFEINRFCGICMGLYTLLTLFGSVYLGWHYAVDGYIGIALAFFIYRSSQGAVKKRTL